MRMFKALLLFVVFGIIACERYGFAEETKTSEVALPVVFDEDFYSETLFSFIHKTFIKKSGARNFPFELIATRGGDESRSPLYTELFSEFYNDVSCFRTWRIRFDYRFTKYLDFYRLKEKVGLATTAEIEECVQKFDKSGAETQALILTCLFIFERIHRPYYGPEDMVKKDDRFWEKKLPAYFIEMLPAYAPDPSISDEQWEKWNELFKRSVDNYSTAFLPSSSRLIEEDSHVFNQRKFLPVKYTLNQMDRVGYDMSRLWVEDISNCLEFLKQLVGTVPTIEEFSAGDSLKKYDSCRQLLAAMDKKGQELQGNERELIRALREYWFSFSCGLSDMHNEDGRRSCIGNRFTYELPLGILTQQLLYARLEYDQEQVKQGKIWHETLPTVDEDISNIKELETTLSSEDEALPIVFDAEFNTDTLYEYIKREAPKMEIFPFDIIVTRNEIVETNAPFFSKLWQYYRYGEGNKYWGARFELSFERYLPFYRFKYKVGLASVAEIEECVQKIDLCTPKEQALILTSIFIFERIRRPFYGLNKYKKKNVVFTRATKLYLCSLLPDYAPDESIPEEKWKEWINVVKKFTHDTRTTAFPAFRPNEQYCSQGFIFSLPDQTSPVEEGTLIKEWLTTRSRYFKLLQKIQGESSLSSDDVSKTYESVRASELFQEVDKAIQKTKGNELELSIALREYLTYVFRRSPDFDPSTFKSSIEVCIGNSSAMPKKIGIIARQILYSRLQYDKELAEDGKVWDFDGIRRPSSSGMVITADGNFHP